MKMKKVTQKDRYGNQVSYEFESDTKQLDPNALLKNMMEGGIPQMSAPPVMGEEFNMGHAPTHPGEPRGEDTIPAWLTPGEFVVNAEATEMFGPEIEAMNEVGRMAKGGMVPMYNDGGYATVRDWYATDDVLDALAQIESGGRHRDSKGNLIRSPAGALGKYQFLPKTAKNPGYSRYGVKPFDIEDEAAQREAARAYLDAIQVRNPEWSKEDVLRAYNWGEAASRQGKAGTREMPKEAAEYPHKIFRELSRMRDHETYFNRGGLAEGQLPGAVLPVPEEGYIPEVEGATPSFVPQERGPLQGVPMPWSMGDHEVPEMEEPAPAPTFGGQDVTASGQVTKEEEFNKQLQYDSILNAVQTGQLDPNQAREALKGMGGNWVGRFDSEARVGGVGEGEGLAGNVAELAHNEIRKPFQDATGITELKKDARKVAEGLGLTDEKTVELNTPQVATVETNPELNQENQPEDPVDAVVKEAQAEDRANKQPETGPGKDQKGPNTDPATVNQTGQQKAAEDPAAFEQAKGAFSEAFGNLFDGTKLAEAAILYLGSRALGYSHGGSLNWVAGNYLKSVTGERAQRQKNSFELAKSGKYTPASIEAYKKSGDISKLVANQGSRVGTGEFKTMLGPNGKPQRVQKYKVGEGQYVWQTDGGQQVTGAWRDDTPSFRKGTPEYRERRTRATGAASARFEEVFKREDRYKVGSGDNISWEQHTRIGPQQAADEFWAWSEKHGLDPESDEALQIMTRAYEDAINEGQANPNAKPKRLQKYLDRARFRSTLGQDEVFQTGVDKDGDPIYVRQEVMDQTDRNVLAAAANLPGTQGLTPYQQKERIYNLGLAEWTKLPDGQKETWNEQAKKSGRSGFIMFLDDRLAQIVSK